MSGGCSRRLRCSRSGRTAGGGLYGLVVHDKADLVLGEVVQPLRESLCVSRTLFTSVRAGITGAGGAIGAVRGGTNTDTCTKDMTGPSLRNRWPYGTDWGRAYDAILGGRRQGTLK